MRKSEAGLMVLLVLSLVLLWVSNSRKSAALERVETLESALPTLVAQRDSSSAVADSLGALTAIQAAAYSADSLAWAEDRARLRGVTDRAERRNSELSRSLAEHMATDTTGLALLDSLQAQHRIVITSLSAEIVTLQEERASLWEQRETLAEQVVALENSAAMDQAIIAQWEAINEAKDDHIRGQRRRKWGERALALATLAVLVAR